VTDILAKVRRRTRRLWNYRRIERALKGKRGLEIGGPSCIFSPATPNGFVPPVYAIAASIDNCNFATSTTWSHGEAGRTFCYLSDREPGMQYIHDATELTSIRRDFQRVVRPKGHVLVIVPNQRYTFDHRRTLTTFAHLESDLAAGTDESDMTHLEEILALHDLEKDKPAGTPEEFRERCLRNREARCMHHHVFDLALLERSLRHAGFHTLYATDAWEMHVLIFARRV
jgi:hypothetical protein